MTWRSRSFPQRYRLGRTHSRTADKRGTAGGVERMKAGDRAEAIFLTGRVVSFGGGRGHTGEGGARRDLRHDGVRMRRVERGENGGRELLEKRRGTKRVFNSWPSQTPYRTRRAVRGGH